MSNSEAISESDCNLTNQIVMKQNGISICINQADNNSGDISMGQDTNLEGVSPCEGELCKKLQQIEFSYDNESHSDNSLTSNGFTKDKKRIKHLVRAEAVRETSLSPPPSSAQLCPTSPVSPNNLLSVHDANVSNENKTLSCQANSEACCSPSSLSRDSSTDNDCTQQELQLFFVDSMKKSPKDRIFLLRVEQELINFMKDANKEESRLSAPSSYNRMLVHRMATYFGLEHNVDASHSSVIITKKEKSKVPETRLKECIKDDESLEEPKKLILKRDSSSMEDSSSGSFEKDKSPDLQVNGSLSDSSRSRSLEEREEHYERVRARIFSDNSLAQSNGEQSSPSVNNRMDNLSSAPATTLSSLDDSENAAQSCDTTQHHDDQKGNNTQVSPKVETDEASKRSSTAKPQLSSSSNHRFPDRRYNHTRNANNHYYARRELNARYFINQTNSLPRFNTFPANAPLYPLPAGQYGCYGPYYYPNDQPNLQQAHPSYMLSSMPYGGQVNASHNQFVFNSDNHAHETQPYSLLPAPASSMNYGYYASMNNGQQLYGPASDMPPPFYGAGGGGGGGMPHLAPMNAGPVNGYIPYDTHPFRQAHDTMRQHQPNTGGGGGRSNNYKNQGQQQRRTLLSTAPPMGPMGVEAMVKAGGGGGGVAYPHLTPGMGANDKNIHRANVGGGGGYRDMNHSMPYGQPSLRPWLSAGEQYNNEYNNSQQHFSHNHGRARTTTDARRINNNKR